MISPGNFKSFLIKNKWLLLSFVILFFISFSYHNKIFSIHFVDEEDNFILGNYLLEGQKLYSDLFSHHQLMVYQGDIKNNNKMDNFYEWMSLVGELNYIVVEKFKNSPPTFFYCDCDEKIVLSYSENYHQMIRDDSKTPLWVLNNKFNSLNEEQENKLWFFHSKLG